MPKHDLSSRHFQRKISEFCELRIAPISSKRMLENVRPYLISLIIYRKRPPVLNGRLDWTAIGEACGIADEMTAELKKQLRPALDAIIRWLKPPPVTEDVLPTKQSTRGSNAQAVKKTVAASSTRKPQRPAAEGAFARHTATSPGPALKPISPFPDPLFEATDDPASFQNALIYHMRRFGDSYWQLHRAVVRLTETFDSKTLLPWIQGERVPRSVASFDILRRIETRYRLSEGYFKASGGKQVLGRTSKMGQRDIRRLLIIGAMTVIRWACRKAPPENSWLARMLAHNPLAELDTQLHRANSVSMGIHELPPGGPSFSPHPLNTPASEMA